jgi:hypothetical protein
MAKPVPEPDWNEIWMKWGELRNMLVHERAPLDENLRTNLFQLQNRVRLSLFDETARKSQRIEREDPRVVFVLDVLAALAVSEPDDPAHPWTRANVLVEVGRYLEAAEEFIVAMERFQAEHARGSGLTGDEDEWARSALYHAVKNLALGGQVLAAAAFLPRLEPDDRDELSVLIDEVPLPAAAGSTGN